ncbi:MAG: hypothetical protein AAF636_19765 [Pseudomonadota bacterium]
MLSETPTTLSDFSERLLRILYLGKAVGNSLVALADICDEQSLKPLMSLERDTQLTNLQVLLMNDPEYAQLFRETETKLRQAQNRLDVALEAIQTERARIEEALLSENLSAEQRRDEEEKLDALMELEEDIRAGQAEIGEMQERMEDQDNPATEHELDDFQSRTDEVVNDAERRLNSEINRSAPASNEEKPTVQVSSEIEVPTL